MNEWSRQKLLAEINIDTCETAQKFSFENWLKWFVFKMFVSTSLGLAAAIYCRVKFGWNWLPIFEWVGSSFAVLLVFVWPIWRWRRRRIRESRDDYTVIDIETTGLKPETCEITELAALRVRNGVVVDHFQELVSITGEIPPEVANKTHITMDMLAGARPAKRVLAAFLKFIGKDKLVGYNLDRFDVPFITFHSRRLLNRTIDNKTIDVWKMAVNCVPGLSSLKLDNLRELYGINASGAHRALKDCEDTNAVYRELRKIETTKTSSERRKSSKAKARKSILKLTETELQTRFGADWGIAAEIIAEKRRMIKSGLSENWDLPRETWDESMRATEGQVSKLAALGVKNGAVLSKREASYLIDDLVLEMAVRRGAEARDNKARKEAEKLAKKEKREAERAAARAAREGRVAERAAAKMAAREGELECCEGHRMRISDECAAKWRSEFQNIWNGLMSAETINVAGLIGLKSWLNQHKRRRDDYRNMIKVIDEVVADGVAGEDESRRLYDTAVEVLNVISADSDESSAEASELPK